MTRGFFLARWLGPSAFGTWNFINIFTSYLRFVSLGTWAAMNREVPFRRGQGQAGELQPILDTVFATTLFCSLIYSIGILGGSLFIESAIDRVALAAFSPVILLLTWLFYAKRLSMATGCHGLVSILETSDSILVTLLSLLFVYWWGLYGAIAGMGVSTLIVFVYAARKLWVRLVFRIDRRILWNLVATGFPMMLEGVLSTALITMDKILIAAMLSRRMLGIYSLANAGVGILITIPSSFGQMLFVKFAEMDGQRKSDAYISAILDKISIIMSALSAFIVSLAIAGFPAAVVLLLPQFVDGIKPGRLLLAYVFFYSITSPLGNWIVSTGRVTSILALRTATIAAEAMAIYLVIRSGGRLEDIAMCVLISSAIVSFSITLLSKHLLKDSMTRGVRCAIKSMLPFASILATIWVQDQLYPSYIAVVEMELMLSCVISLFVGLAINIPIIYLVNKETRVIQLVYEALSQRSRRATFGPA